MSAVSPASPDDGRLERFVTPRHYDLHYTSIDLDRNSFEGTVAVRLEVVTAPARAHGGSVGILIHALELTLTSARVSVVDDDDDENNGTPDDVSLEAEEFRYSRTGQTCEMIFDDARERVFFRRPHHHDVHDGAPPPRLLLVVEFRGRLNGNMQGLYRSSYVGLDGATRHMATTQFEPTDARRAFPCWDEPALKATFRLRVDRPYDDRRRCLSNTPVESRHTTHANATTNTTTNNNNLVTTTTFHTTPAMSTYLLALVVGDFDAISHTSPTSGVTTTVYTVPGKATQGAFCLEVASRCLDLYGELFDVPYPLPKSDLLAIPDFAAGAMENWGCVTYREVKILVKEGSTSETIRRGIARTVCHELAHQWFGNLVTMEFWTQLWLNEGFARFMEFVGVDALFPAWDAWTEFVQSVYGLALSLDAMASSHPVEVTVRHPDEINEIFDAISYAKGASVIRMVSTLVGFEVFMRGMRLYLKRHAYGNCTTDMLWAALEEVSHLPVAALMTPWTSQTGFPLVRLHDDDDGTIVTTRFLASGEDETNEEDNGTWPIPITVRVSGEEKTHGPFILYGGPSSSDDEQRLSDNIVAWSKAGKWFKLNVSQTGFYRVAYGPTQWARLADALHADDGGVGLDAADRIGLISDSFAAGRAGYASIVDSLKLVRGFGEHDTAEYAVWQELSENLANLASLYRSEPFFDSFQTFLHKIYSHQMQRLGWESSSVGESQRTGTLRGTVINILRIAGDKTVSVESLRRFRRFLEDADDKSALSGDLRTIVFKAALCEDEQFVYNELKVLFEKSTFPEEQRSCLTVMGSVKDMNRHKEMIEYVLFSGKVRLQDIAFPLNALASSTDVGGKACWNLLKCDFENLYARFHSGPMWGSLIGLCCRGLTTLAEADEVELFFADPSHPCGSGTRRLAQALEAVRNKAIRLDRDREDVTRFLAVA